MLQPDRGSAAQPLRPLSSVARLLVGLVVAALLVGACVNRGFDEDPTASSDGAGAADEATDGGADTDGEATGSGDDAGAGPTTGAELPAGAVPDPAALAAVEPTECAFDELVPLPRRPVCYAVSVPVDWSAPDPDDRVVLQVAVFTADPGASPTTDATIYLDGGPGVATLDLLWSSFGQVHGPQIGPRDYILFDQRGVGLSEPALTCPELSELELVRLAGGLDPDEEASASVDAVRSCRERLEAAGADLDAYNSVASANDVEAIRVLLGYDRLNLLGVSYGTRLAQTHLRLYPDSVRSVVLDSIVPVEADLWTNLAPEAVGAFEQLFDGCAADPACAEAHPDLEERFFALLDRLDAQPIEVEFTDFLQGTSIPAVVDGGGLIGLVFSALYDRSSFALVPAMVGEVENGDHDTVEFFGSVEITNSPYAALGQRLSVECNEEIAFEDESALAALTPTEPGYERLGVLDGEATLFELCRQWPAGRAPDEESRRVTSDVPALLLAGRYDPITRPGNADVVAAGLPNSFTFVLPNEGHGIVSSACGAQLVADFLADPATEPDGSCVAAGPTPAWVPGDGEEEVALVDFAVDQPFQVAGRRPAEWIDAGNGVFARQRTAIDPTSLIVQPTGGIVPSFLVELLGTQLEVTFVEGEPLVIEGRGWAVYASDDDPDQVVRLAVSEGRDGVMVVLVATAAEIEALETAVFRPAVEAATTG